MYCNVAPPPRPSLCPLFPLSPSVPRECFLCLCLLILLLMTASCCFAVFLGIWKDKKKAANYIFEMFVDTFHMRFFFLILRDFVGG